MVPASERRGGTGVGSGGVDHKSRLVNHTAVSAALDELSDGQLRDGLAATTSLGSGIGGEAALLDVAGIPVFVKRVAVTDLEREPGNIHGTENVFGLPMCCHYGVGAPSAGAWRELRTHQLTSEWVVADRCDAFPLLHHWRVLPLDAPMTLDCAEHGDLETWVAFWHGSDAVAQRLQAQAAASAVLLLFLEYVPQDMLAWLNDKMSEGPRVLDPALTWLEARLIDVATFMAANGLHHFDAHFRNILADDSRLYVSDFGLAASSSFALTATEANFLDEHREHDAAYVVTQLVNWTATHLTDEARTWTDVRDRNEFVRRCADG